LWGLPAHRLHLHLHLHTLLLSLLDPLHRYQKEVCLVHQDHHLNYF
jgi:hypothetical protein